jgi:hypothetical protein
MPRVLSEEPDEIRNVFIPQMVCDLLHLVWSSKKVPFRFEYDVFIDQV